MSKVPLNALDATAISFPDWMQFRSELDSKCAGNTDVPLREFRRAPSLALDDT